MQKLEFPKRDEPNGTKSICYPIPDQFAGVDVSVEDGKESVALVVDGRRVMISISGARDLALALRQSANRVQKNLG